MSTNIDRAEPEGPELQSSLLLNFLVKRFNEALTTDSPKVPFLLQGLGLVGLGTDEELLSNYKGLLASSILPPAEIIRRAVEIFQIALERDPDTRSTQRPPGEVEDDQEPDEKCCRQIMMNAIREGRLMLEEGDDGRFRYLQVFVMLGWIALSCDPLRQAEFDATCHTFADDPEGLIKAGREILKDALFRRNRH